MKGQNTSKIRGSRMNLLKCKVFKFAESGNIQAVRDLKALNSMNRKSLDIHSIAEFYAIEKNVY